MATKSNTQAKGARTKSRGKGKKRAKRRAAPLSTSHARKTTGQQASRKSRPSRGHTPATTKHAAGTERSVVRREQANAEQRAEPPETILYGTSEDPGAQSASGASTAKSRREPMAHAAVTKTNKALSDGISALATSTSDAAEQVAHTMPRATNAAMAMMMRQQSLAFGLWLNALQIQRQLFNIWLPRHR